MTDHTTLSPDGDPTQVCEVASDATSSVLLRGTTANEASGLGKSGWDIEGERWRASPPAPRPMSGGARKRTGTERGRSVDDHIPAAPVPMALEVDADEWQADMEHVWRTRVASVIASLDERARRRRREARAVTDDGIVPNWAGEDDSQDGIRVAAEKSAEWAEYRARALAMARADVVGACGQRWRRIQCGCSMLELKVGCDQPQLCSSCRVKHAQRWRRRITDGMDAALRRERKAWWGVPRYRRRGRAPGIYLLTLTAPHSGDLAVDRERMGRAVRKLLKHATAEGWWRTYALTWEATGGTRGDGHMHCHLAVISSWIPYTSAQALTADVNAYTPRRKGERKRIARGLHEVWRDAMPGALVLDVSAPRKGADDAASAGGYLAKYVTKGVDAAEFTGRKAGELLVAFRARRKVTTSAGFWREEHRECPCCEQAWRATDRPISLVELMPGAVLRAWSERTRYRDGDRVPPQVGLRWGGG